MIIAVANQKGGVGKTTTVVNLAHHFARKGRRVLVVDMDVQGHAGVCLGLGKGDGLFRLLVDEEPIGRVKAAARPGLDLVQSDKTSERIKLYIAEHGAPALTIGAILQDADRDYDLTVIDMAPGSDVLHVGALVAADYYLVPASMEFLALDGVMEVMRSVAALKRIPNVTPPVLVGVLPTRYDRVAVDIRENVQRLSEAVGVGSVLPPIPRDVRVPESAGRGLTIWEYAPDTAAAVGYKNGSMVRNSDGKTGGYLHLAEIVESFVR